jgi:hypothetical protein
LYPSVWVFINFFNTMTLIGLIPRNKFSFFKDSKWNTHYQLPSQIELRVY